MKKRTNGHGVFYHRDSGGKAEMAPSEYLNWAMHKAQELNIAFKATSQTITQMIKNKEPQRDDVFLDYVVKGNKLTREALDRLLETLRVDSTITHVLMTARDRLARPNETYSGMALEEKIRRLGVCVVYMKRTLRGLKPRERIEPGEGFTSYADFSAAGEERQTLAWKGIFAKIALAKLGFSIGGKPPYPFERWLVTEDGSPVRKLAAGEKVKQAGRHVAWMPSNPEGLALALRIREMVRSIPASRVAATLNKEGIPSPNAGCYRTKGGVKKLVSGLWHQNTIINIGRNPLFSAITVAGRRATGDQLRLTPKGPRDVERSEMISDDQTRVICNPEANWITAKGHFEPIVTQAEHESLVRTLDIRAGTQRNKPRSRNLSINPLGTRIFDWNCGAVMYFAYDKVKKKFSYKCSRYMQSHAVDCERNCIDGTKVTKFALAALQQKILSPEAQLKLKAKLHELAQYEFQDQSPDLRPSIEKQIKSLESLISKVKSNMARAATRAQYEAIAEEFEKLRHDLDHAKDELAHFGRSIQNKIDIESEVAAALKVAENLSQLKCTQDDLPAISEAFRLIDVRMYLAFKKVIVGEKQHRNKLSHGAITFGSQPAPIALYEGPTGRNVLKSKLAAASAAIPSRKRKRSSSATCTTDQEVDSLGNVNHGER